jgi:hypothetical protein
VRRYSACTWHLRARRTVKCWGDVCCVCKLGAVTSDGCYKLPLYIKMCPLIPTCCCITYRAVTRWGSVSGDAFLMNTFISSSIQNTPFNYVCITLRHPVYILLASCKQRCFASGELPFSSLFPFSESVMDRSTWPFYLSFAALTVWQAGETDFWDRSLRVTCVGVRHPDTLPTVLQHSGILHII